MADKVGSITCNTRHAFITHFQVVTLTQQVILIRFTRSGEDLVREFNHINDGPLFFTENKPLVVDITEKYSKYPSIYYEKLPWV